MGLSPVHVKFKTIKLVFAASRLSVQQCVKAKTGWLGRNLEIERLVINESLPDMIPNEMLMLDVRVSPDIFRLILFG